MSNEDKPNYMPIPDNDPEANIQHSNNQNQNQSNPIINNNNGVNPQVIDAHTVNEEKFLINVCALVYSLILSIIWYCLFRSFSNNQEHFGSEKDCIQLRSISEGLTSYYYNLILLLTFMIILAPCTSKQRNCANILFDITSFIYYLVVIIFTIIYLILMTEAMQYNEKCGDLRVLALVWLILFYIMIFSMCCCCVCLLMCYGIRAMSTDYINNTHNNNSNNNR